MIKTLLFDYAGVITPTRNNYVFVEKYHKKYKLKPRELMKITYENWEQTADGKLESKLFWNNIAHKLQTTPPTIRRQILSTYPIDKRLIQLLTKLKEKYTLVLVSNQIRDWLEEVIEQNNLREIFDYTVNSYQVGFRKPNSKIFKHALSITGSKPEEAIFIDDAQINITAANKLGINTILFTDYRNFKQELNFLLKNT